MSSETYYKISPTEYEKLLKKKRDELRINRLVQMREASKLVRKKQKEQYTSSKQDKESIRNEILKQEWERERQQKIEALRKQLEAKQKFSGVGMQLAKEIVSERQNWASEAYWQFQEDENMKHKRGQEALKIQLDEMRDKNREVMIQRKEMVKQIERERTERVVEEKPYSNQENVPLHQASVDGEYHANLNYLQEKTQQLLSSLKPLKQRDLRWNDKHNDYTKTMYHDRPKLVTEDKPKSFVCRADPSTSTNAIEEARIASERTQNRMQAKIQENENARITAIRRAREAYQKIKEQELTAKANDHLEVMNDADRKRKQREIGSMFITSRADKKLESEKERKIERDFEILMRSK